MIILDYENNILSVVSETENIMNDMLLSGFHSVQMSTLERIKSLESAYSKLNMQTGAELILQLYNELNKRRNSFEYNINNITKIFCKLEFYIRNASEKIN